MTNNVEYGSKPRAQVLAIFAMLTTSLVACASAPLAKKSVDPHKDPGPGSSGTAEAPPPPPPPPNPDDASAEIVIVAVPKPTSPIAKNDAIDTDSAIRKESKLVEEPQRARGTQDPLLSSSGLEMAGEGGAPGGGINGVASNNKSRGGYGAAAAPAPMPDGSGSANTSGTQIAAASEVRGSIDKAEIRRVVMAHAGEMKRCYEQGLARRPDLEGRVALKFTIERTGTVVAVSVMETSLNDRQSELCMLRAASKWVFPKPSGDGLVTVSYPFIFKSSE